VTDGDRPMIGTSESPEAAVLRSRVRTEREPRDEAEPLPFERVLELLGGLFDPSACVPCIRELHEDLRRWRPERRLREHVPRLFCFYSEGFYVEAGYPVNGKFLHRLSRYLRKLSLTGAFAEAFVRDGLHRAVWPVVPLYGTTRLVTALIRYDTLSVDHECTDGSAGFNASRAGADARARELGRNRVAEFCLDSGVCAKLMPLFEGELSDDMMDGLALMRRLGRLARADRANRPP